MEVVELKLFTNSVKKFLSKDEIKKLSDFLSENPTTGDLIQKTGGLRKLRWGIEGRGKSGGCRVIYYFCNKNFPLLLVFGYAKNVQENLTEKQKKELKNMVNEILKINKGK
ncbi:MAG: type II toxin-antitoxin system RelE/ParE family toxin [Rickettsiales bacterium]|nr:type II toxin-antitoxin system RelE/ParE family toxin [Rickettsiales bacterium]